MGDSRQALLVFDNRPATIGGFRLHATGATHEGKKASKNGIKDAMAFARAAEFSSPYWVDDLLAFAEREKWEDVIEWAVDELGLAKQTVYNRVYVARHVVGEARAIAPSPGHAAAVAKLPAEEQVEILSEARDGELTVAETRQRVKTRGRRKVIDVRADVPVRDKANAHVVLADMQDGVDYLQSQLVGEQCHERAVLFLIINPDEVYDKPGPESVMERWGFHFRTTMVWDGVIDHDHHKSQTAHYVGYLAPRHRLVLVATKGDALPDKDVRNGEVDTVLTSRTAPNLGAMLERIYEGPYLAVGCVQRDGWERL